ncbi:hypothetical protein ACFSR9_13125 [Deinococcus taklimakanensis]|uniref:DUF4304 domain-containing protein n=1 Tax=Deinococcus taklimakanensis TaxID=536443 RepID=A0ABW5P7A9_9DEIO
MKSKDTMPDLSSLSGTTRDALEKLQRAMSEMGLTRYDEWGFVLFGRPWIVRCRPQGEHLQLEVWPYKPQEFHKELFSYWHAQSGSVWTFLLTGPDDVKRAVPLIQAAHHQAQREEVGRAAGVERFVAELRAAFQELGPDIVVKNTKSTEQYWRGDTEIARVRPNKAIVTLSLRHTFSTLDNPEDLGGTFRANRRGWPQDYFEAYFHDSVDIERLKPLFRQTYEANRAGVP